MSNCCACSEGLNDVLTAVKCTNHPICNRTLNTSHSSNTPVKKYLTEITDLWNSPSTNENTCTNETNTNVVNKSISRNHLSHSSKVGNFRRKLALINTTVSDDSIEKNPISPFKLLSPELILNSDFHASGHSLLDKNQTPARNDLLNSNNSNPFSVSPKSLSKNQFVVRNPFDTPSSDESCKSATESEDSADFENLMHKLRTNIPEKCIPRNSPNSSFIVEDHSSSEISSSNKDDSPTFYRRLDNTKLKKSISLRNRRRIFIDSSSDSSSPNSDISDNDDSISAKSEPFCSPISFIKPRQHHPTKPTNVPPQLLKPSSLQQYPNAQICLPVPPARKQRIKKHELKETQQRQGILEFIDSLHPLFSQPPHANNWQRHPSAEKYIKKFKPNRKDLANRLLAFFNEVVFEKQLPDYLEVEWNERLLKTAGQCIYLRRKVTDRNGIITESQLVRIELSGKVCTSTERVRDTLLHEACHAAVWLIHGINDGHGPLWKAFASKANRIFPNIPPVSVRHNYAIDTRFTYQCTGCGVTINRHSKSLDVERKVCGNCRSRFQLFVNTPHGRMMRPSVASRLDRRFQSCDPSPVTHSSEFHHQTPGSLAPPSNTSHSVTRVKPAFAGFVQSNYKTVRPGVSHKDAMIQLGSMFKAMKVINTTNNTPSTPAP